MSRDISRRKHHRLFASMCRASIIPFLDPEANFSVRGSCSIGTLGDMPCALGIRVLSFTSCPLFGLWTAVRRGGSRTCSRHSVPCVAISHAEAPQLEPLGHPCAASTSYWQGATAPTEHETLMDPTPETPPSTGLTNSRETCVYHNVALSGL